MPEPGTRRQIGRTDLTVTVLGVGGGPFGNLFAAVSDEAVADTIGGAVEASIGYFDTSPFYGFGLSERRVGDALRWLPRESFTLSTKVGRLLTPLPGGVTARAPSAFKSPMPFDAIFNYGYDAVMRSWEDSLQRLGLATVDILLFHDLARDMHSAEDYGRHFRIAMESGMRAAEELRAGGQIKAIGFGVNHVEPCLETLEAADPDVFLLASRYTLLEQAEAAPLLAACARRGVSIIAGAPFNSGVLVVGSKAATTYDHAPAPAHILERVRAIEAVCATHSVPLPAAALQFPLRHPVVATVLPGLRSPAELASAVDWFRVDIPEAFWADMAAQGLIEG